MLKTMTEVVANTNVQREKGYLYFIDKDGDVARAAMSRGSTREKGSQKVTEANISKESGYLYFLDKNGNIARTKMARGRK